MPEDVKKRALVLILAALMMTALIGAALPRLQFQPGMPLPSLENGQVVLEAAPAEPPVGVSINAFMGILFLIIAAVFFLVMLYRMIKGVAWKRLLKNLFSSLATLFVVLAVVFIVLTLLPKSQAIIEAQPLPFPKTIARSPLGPVPSLLLWFVGLGLLASVVLLGVWMLRSKRAPEPPLWQLEAEYARQAILAGGDLKDVIVRCYQQMSLALAQEREIEREASMTTGEFEALLTSKGVPYNPVHQLTQLFEAVRYGHRQPKGPDEQRALQSLDAILEYSRAPGQEG